MERDSGAKLMIYLIANLKTAMNEALDAEQIESFQDMAVILRDRLFIRQF